MPPTAPPEFLRYSPADIVQMGRERGTAPEQIAQAVTKHRDNLTAYGMQTYGERFNAALPRLQEETNTALEELKPGFGLGDTLSGIGSMLGGLPTTVPAAYYGVTEGFTRPDQYSPEARAAFDANAAYQQRMQQESQQRLERGEATSTGDAFRSAGPSLGGTVGSMAAAIPAGMTAGALAGSFIEPGGGTVGGGLVGAAASGLAAAAGAGTVAYRMAGQQFLNDAFTALQQQRGGQMSEAEKQQAYNELLPLAENSALWEAGPEAIGNAVSLGTAKIVFGLGKPLLTNLAKTALGKAGVKVGTIAGSQAVELGGETATALGQGVTQAQAEAYARGDANWRQARSAYDRPGGTLQALKDIAPATLALGATTLGAGGVAKLATLPFQKPNDNVSPNQTPAPSGSPQAPGTTPATAAMAGGAGAVPSTLSRIAQESLVPDLPEFTGELTAEDVQDLERVGQTMSDPSTTPPAQTFTGSNVQMGTEMPVPSPTANAGAGTGAMGRVPAFADDPLTAPVTESGDVINDLRIPRSPAAIAESQRLENERQSQIARLRMIDNKAQGMPLIPDSPRGDKDILDFANENPIYLPPGFSKERNLPEYEKLKEAKLPAYWRQFVASSKHGGNPEQVAQRAFEAGLISEPDAGLYLDAVREGIDSRQQYRVDFAAREKALETEEKQVIDFEKTQQTLRRKDKERVRFEDIAPGDEMTIDGEQAVVRNIEYTEDGYLTNVVIEDGKRFGLMQFDPQTRSGLFVDEFTPKEREPSGTAEEPLFSRAAPRMDFSGLMQNAQAVASGQQAPQTSAALAGMFAAPTPEAPAGARPAGNGGARGVQRFFPSSLPPTPTLPPSQTQTQGGGGGVRGGEGLRAAYREATRGSGTQMATLSSVYAQARLLQPGLTPEAFLAQVQEGYNNGTLYLEGAGSQQEAAAAGLSLPGTNVGTAVRMMPVPDSGNPASSIQQPASSLASPAELAANQKANEAILQSLGLPTKKGTRVWGAAKIKAALAKLSTDERYPATTRAMARELSKLSLDNLLLKIEADARLNWAGLYQPFTDGRGELSLNTRTMGRGDLDIGITLVHEALHHATYRNLRSPRTARQKQAKADLEALFKRAKAALAVNGRLSQFDYELSNTDEFITGLFTRADFQAALADIPADAAPQTLGQRVRSVLDEIFRVLAELVTSKAVPPGSVLEASMAATLRLMEDGRTVAEMDMAALKRPVEKPRGKAKIKDARNEFMGQPSWQSFRDAIGVIDPGSIQKAGVPTVESSTRTKDAELTALWRSGYQSAPNAVETWRGGEHTLELKGPRVMKQTHPETFGAQYDPTTPEILQWGTPLRYLQRWRLFNELFPGADVRFEGVVMHPNGTLSLKISQPVLQGTKPEADEIAAVLTKDGWQKMALNTWRKGDLLMTDTKPDNFFKLADGLIVPVDVVLQEGMAEAPLMNPAQPEMRESRSAFVRPEQADRMKPVQGNDLMLAEAAQWLAGVDDATAVQQLETGRAPEGLRSDHLPALAERTMQRLVQTMASDKELVRLRAEALLDRAGLALQNIINDQAGRGLQQVGAANARLLPIAPILAVKRILVQRAEVVMDKRFEGGAEGAVEKVKVILQKADTQASTEVAQAVQDTVEMAPPVDPAAARAAVNAITQTARTYFGGTLPPRVKILHQEQAEWDARMNGNVLELNAAALETSQVVGKIEHEIGHLLFQDPAMRQQFDALWNSLDVNERAQIENITAALYDAANRNEEASVRALDTVRQMVEAKNPGLWQRFVTWLRQAWERLTGRLPRDPRRLAAVMIETGVARLKGVEGNQTEVRESRRSDLLKVNSPQLARLLNSLRVKVAPGLKWRDIFTDMPATQLERQREIYKRLMQHKALVKLSANERLQLTNELDKAWQRARKKVFDKELEKAGVLGEKDASDRKKAKAVLPKMLRMINLGMFDSAAWRDAVAPQYGLRVLTSADTAQLRTLAEAAWKLPEGVIRNQKLRDLLNAIQKKTGASWIEVLNSYWTAAVLSGLRTQFDTWLAAMNGMGTNLMQIGGLVARGQGRAAIDAHAQWWRGLFEGVRESGQILFKGDTSYLKRFGADLKKALEGETSVTPVPLGENLWKNGNTFQKYGLAPVMMFTGRLMAAADHINNTATTQGAIAVARALHPELYQGKVGFTETERADARTQALREVTGGSEPKTGQERATVSARTREILNGTVKPTDYAAASEIGDMAAYQNDPTGLFGVVYSAMKQGLGSIQRKLGDYAEDLTANRFTRVISGMMAGSLHGITGTRFMRFGANFGADLTRYIPGSYVLGKAGFYGRDVSRMQQELLLGKNIVGLMLASTLAAVFLNSDDEDEGWQIEGDWSTLNPQQAKERMAAGYERLTMWKRDGDQVRRVSYKQWPTMGLFAVVGGMLDEKRHKPASWAQHGTAGHLLRGVATGYTQVKNVSAVRNLVELFGEPTFSADAVSGTIEKMTKIGTNFAGGFMPTLIKDAETWTDPRNFKPEGTSELMLRSMPIARKFVNDGRPQLNLLGEEVKLQRAPWSRTYTSVESGEAHRVLGALLARGLALPMPSDQVTVFKDNVRVPLETLGRDAVWKYEKAVGQGYKEWLYLEGSDLLKLPAQEADARIKARAEAIKARAKAQVLR
jgi:hypothetical protein